MTIGTIIIILLVLLLIGAIPAWPYSRSWGAFPSRRRARDRHHPRVDEGLLSPASPRSPPCRSHPGPWFAPKPGASSFRDPSAAAAA